MRLKVGTPQRNLLLSQIFTVIFISFVNLVIAAVDVIKVLRTCAGKKKIFTPIRHKKLFHKKPEYVYGLAFPSWASHHKVLVVSS